MRVLRATATAAAVAAALACGPFMVDTAEAQVQQQVDFTVQADGSVIVTLADGQAVTLDAATASEISSALASDDASAVGAAIETLVSRLGGSTELAAAIATYAADGTTDQATVEAISNAASRGAADPTASAEILRNVSNRTGISMSVLNDALQNDPGQRPESQQAANEEAQEVTQQAALDEGATQAGPPDDNTPDLPDEALNSDVPNTTENPSQDVSPGQN